MLRRVLGCQLMLCVTYLEGDVCLRANFGWWQLHIGILPNKVDCDELLALLPSKASEAAADRLVVRDDALGPVLALVVIARARLEKNHRRRSFAEQSTAERDEKKKQPQLSPFLKEGNIFRCRRYTTAIQPPRACLLCESCTAQRRNPHAVTAWAASSADSTLYWHRTGYSAPQGAAVSLKEFPSHTVPCRGYQQKPGPI